MSISPRKLLAGAAVNVLGFAAQLVVSFAMAPVVLHALGKTRYGVWSFVESLLAYLLLFDLGVGASLVRFVPRFVASNDVDALNRVYSACLTLFLAIGAGIAVVGCGLVAALGGHLDVPTELASEAQIVLFVSIVNFALTLAFSVFPAVLDGLHAFAAKSLIRTSFLLARIPAVLLAIGTARPLLNLILVYAATNLIESLTLVAVVYRQLPGLRFTPRAVDRATIRDVRGYSLDAFLAMIAGRLSFQTDAFVIVGVLGPAAITPFALANRLVDMSKSALRQATTTLTPAASALQAADNLAAVRTYFLHGSRLALYAVLPIQAGLYLLGRPFLQLWLRADFDESSVPVLYVLAATLSLTVAQSAASRILYGLGNIRLFARMALVEGVANVFLSVVLVNSLGIVGVAWGTTIPHAVFCIFAVATVLRRLDIGIAEYVWRATMLPSAAAAVLTALWLTQSAPTTWGEFVKVGCIGTVPYALIIAMAEWRCRANLGASPRCNSSRVSRPNAAALVTRMS
ncbi:MAG: polysaccharide biosynthesis C-terminal domain-containing protein [Gemmataceae bacterium]